ncbi:hypothetical protein NM688_g7709 [Phlebia brevispora]|uniref:Uncharacterized protein n=1 Tax=Phlebia brevispora TaxID=194682 RepID=A0ACC1S1Y3_9APHY|nr:hypothetical protein NM688_g7709 [Phlebia brevispora]
MLAAHADDAEQIKSLRHWTRVHRPSIYPLAIHALGALADPSIGERDLCKIEVRTRLDETKIERKYEIVSATVCSIDSMGPLAPQIHARYTAEHERANAPPHGTFLLAVHAEGSQSINLVPMGFELGGQLFPGFSPEKAIASINAGYIMPL